MPAQPVSPYAKESALSFEESEVIKTVLYFDIFQFPLRIDEIHANYSAGEIELGQIEILLKDLIRQGILETRCDFFYLKGRRDYVDRRLRGEVLAKEAMQRAQSVTRKIARCPYVRAVLISGSLSKGYMDAKSDIDFFVVTKPGRLWLAKGWLTFIKKTRYLNSKKNFCLNYFIDQDHLNIPDQNLFTARELFYLIPIYNSLLYKQMLDKNPWAADTLPNWKHRTSLFGDHSITVNSGRKRWYERNLKGKFGGFLERRSMRTFEWFWKRKYRKSIKVNQDVQIRCLPHVSKIHPNNFQEKVLTRLQKKYDEFKTEFQRTIN